MVNLIIGGGFIGSHIAERLATNGAVRVFSRSLDLPPDSASGRVEFLRGDFFDETMLEEALEGVQVVYHALSTTIPLTANQNPARDLASNVGGTLKLLQLCIKQGVRRVIFISSGGTIYGTAQSLPITEDHPTHPLTSYGISKLCIEKYLLMFHQLHGLDYRILRLANPYGERQAPTGEQGAIASFAWKALCSEVIQIWGDGSIIRDYVYIHDAVTAIALAASTESLHRLFNIGSGRGYSLNDVVAELTTLIGHRPLISYTPGRAFDVPVNILDISRAKHELGWQPQIGFQEGLRRTLDWLQKEKSKVS